MSIFRRAIDAVMGRQLLVGVDIGSTSIKLCRLKKSGSGLELVRFDLSALPAGAIENGVIRDFRTVSNRLSELARVNWCAGAKCALSMSGFSTVIKHLCIPKMTQEQLQFSAQYEVEQYIP